MDPDFKAEYADRQQQPMSRQSPNQVQTQSRQPSQVRYFLYYDPLRLSIQSMNVPVSNLKGPWFFAEPIFPYSCMQKSLVHHIYRRFLKHAIASQNRLQQSLVVETEECGFVNDRCPEIIFELCWMTLVLTGFCFVAMRDWAKNW